MVISYQPSSTVLFYIYFHEGNSYITCWTIKICEGIILAKIQTIYKYSHLTWVASNSLPDSLPLLSSFGKLSPYLHERFRETWPTASTMAGDGSLRWFVESKMETYLWRRGKVWRYHTLNPMNPTKWSNISKINGIHLEFRGTQSWKTRHGSWVISTKHWPVLQRTQSLHMNITMGVPCCSCVFHTCYFTWHISGISLGTCSPPCFKLLIVRFSFRSWVDDLLSLMSQNGKPSWMRKRKCLLGFHFYDPMTRILRSLPEPTYHGGNDATSKGQNQLQLNTCDSGNEDCSILQPINLDPPLLTMLPMLIECRWSAIVPNFHVASIPFPFWS